MEVFSVPYSQRASTMRLPFLSEALVQNLNLLSKERWVLWLRGCARAVKSPLGVAHGGVLSPIHSAGLQHAAPLPLRGLATKFESLFSKTLGFRAVLGLFMGPLRCLTLGQPPSCSFLSFQRH